MWRSKKFIIGAVLVAVLLTGSIGAVALAADNGDDSQPKARSGALLDKVCEIYNANPDRPGDIDCALLKAAFAQAASEMRPKVMQNRPKMGAEAMQDRPKMDSEAMQDRLQSLVNEGKITQEQADALQGWWDSRPNVPTQEQADAFKKWMEARPDVPFGFGLKDRGGFPGKGGPCAPAE
ncbi:MAG: hypothetical protein FJ006_02860 [Chloroflexi bacterium]|nr:hypothetical protein [Chloroflexota bacterium]